MSRECEVRKRVKGISFSVEMWTIDEKMEKLDSKDGEALGQKLVPHAAEGGVDCQTHTGPHITFQLPNNVLGPGEGSYLAVYRIARNLTVWSRYHPSLKHITS